MTNYPEQWKIAKPFRYCHIIRGSSPFQKDDLRESGDFVAVQYGKSYKVDLIDEDFSFYVSNSFHKDSQEVKKGDTVYITTSETVGDLGHTCYYDRSDIGLLGGEQLVLRPFEHIWDNKYFFYSASCFHHELNKFATGLKVYRVKADDLKRIDVCIPPKTKQLELSAYLDQKTSLIDSIISDKEEILTLLSELRQAIISEAVTKGLDPHAQMKDSGVEWIGEIPVEWEVVATSKLLSKTMNGLTRRESVGENTGTIVLRIKEISGMKIDYSSVNRINLSSDEQEKYLLDEGDILFVRVNGSKELVGKSAIFTKIDEPVIFNDHIIKVSLTTKISPSYFLNYLYSFSGKLEIANKINTAAGQYTISGEKLKQIKIPLPPLEIQEQIVRYLDEKTQKIDQITADTKEQIALLKEYRQSLISDVVTGKVEV